MILALHEVKIRLAQQMRNDRKDARAALNRTCDGTHCHQCSYARLLAIMEQICQLLKFRQRKHLKCQIRLDQNAQIKINVGEAFNFN